MNQLQGKRILCFGDSITGNYIAPNDYPTILSEILGADVINMGFGGAHMGKHPFENWGAFSMHKMADSIVAGDFSWQEERLGGTVDYFSKRISVLKTIDFKQVDYITIFYGTNDWGRLLDASDQMDPTTFMGALRYSITKLLGAYPHLRILLVTPIYRYFPEEPGVPDGEHFKRGDYPLSKIAEAILTVGAQLKIPVADLYGNLGIDESNRSLYFDEPDGTHPNTQGQKLIAQYLAKELGYIKR